MQEGKHQYLVTATMIIEADTIAQAVARLEDPELAMDFIRDADVIREDGTHEPYLAII